MSEESKSHKPKNTAFRQQRLRAWQPILTPKTVLPTFFLVGIIFSPIGGVLLYSSDSVSEMNIDYTDCATAASSVFQDIPENRYNLHYPQSSSPSFTTPRWKVTQDVTTIDPLTNASLTGPRCTLQFPVLSTLEPPIFMYYRLTNFYQNHRKYVKSFDADQLYGKARTQSDMKDGGCKDYLSPSGSSAVYYPCGFIARSVFNDTLSSLTRVDDNSTQYIWSEKGIAWSSDTSKYKPTTYSPDPSTVVPPDTWVARYGANYTAESIQKVHTDEHLIVWMRTAGLPTFRKLYGRNDDQALTEGMYSIDIDMRFDVLSYGGRKSLVISTVAFLGGRNSFLGIAYIVVGCVCVVLGCLFTVRHLYRPRKLGDHTYLSWNQAGGASSTPGGVGASGGPLSSGH
ncbi:MAG: CDC50 family protein [Piptocephalis tieghemiana]|nr:MAG: CDC50 family protein [Piptocephalis tieghemiana]